MDGSPVRFGIPRSKHLLVLQGAQTNAHMGVSLFKRTPQNGVGFPFGFYPKPSQNRFKKKKKKKKKRRNRIGSDNPGHATKLLYQASSRRCSQIMLNVFDISKLQMQNLEMEPPIINHGGTPGFPLVFSIWACLCVGDPSKIYVFFFLKTTPRRALVDVGR